MKENNLKDQIDLLEIQLQKYREKVNIMQIESENNLQKIEEFKSLIDRNRKLDSGIDKSDIESGVSLKKVSQEILWLKNQIVQIHNDMQELRYILKNYDGSIYEKAESPNTWKNQGDLAELKQILESIHELMQEQQINASLLKQSSRNDSQQNITFRDLPRFMDLSLEANKQGILRSDITKDVSVSYQQPGSSVKIERSESPHRAIDNNTGNMNNEDTNLETVDSEFEQGVKYHQEQEKTSDLVGNKKRSIFNLF